MRIGHEQGALQDAALSEVSLSGISLDVSRVAVETLARSGSTLLAGDHFRVFSVPGTPPIDGIDCHTVVVRRLSRDKYLVGAAFAESTPENEQTIRDLIERAARGG